MGSNVMRGVFASPFTSVSDPLVDLHIDPLGGDDGNSGASWSEAIRSPAPLADLLAPGMTVELRASTVLRGALPSMPGVTYRAFNAAVLGSEAVKVGGATLVTGTRYKIATALHRPNTGGTTNSLYLYTNGIGYAAGATPTPIRRNAVVGSTTPGAGEWSMPGDGFLYFDLGRAVTASDVFEVPQRVGVSGEHPGMRVLGGTWRHSEGHTFALNQANAFNGFELGWADAGWTSSDVFNCTLGTATGLWVHDCKLHKAQSDGAGGGDGFSAHGGCGGLLERVTLADCEKTGLANSEKGRFTYRDLLFDAAVFNIYNDNGAPGRHTVRRFRMMNEWPNLVAAGTHMFWVLPSLDAASVIDIDGASIDRGTGSADTLRAFRAQSGTVIAHNIAVSSFGSAHPFSTAFMQSAAAWTESFCAAGGNTTNFDGGWGGSNDITLVAGPFNDPANGDLRPKAALVGTGYQGRDIGYTSDAPA